MNAATSPNSTNVSNSPTAPIASRPPRLAITSVRPTVMAGHYPAKRVVGDIVEFAAIVVCDGHESIAAELVLTSPDGSERIVPMVRRVGYQFVADVALTELGVHEFVISAWIDRAATLQSKISRKAAAGQPTANEEIELGQLGDTPTSDRVDSRLQLIVVDRVLASFGAWYEFFPRSTGQDGHGTLRTSIDRLDYVRDAGFDILYLPPIHPIGREHRKGADNNVVAAPGDVGSPWAIGAAEGGHTTVHPDLGTIDDFDALIAAANERGLEIALDIAFQCSPDHPWVAEHPEWFAIRPDGSIAYAENPPKQYQDIVPFNFDSEAWPALWEALADVVRYWHSHGVRVFRVDNPHTKPFQFWEWMIAELKRDDPGVIFLAEAFAHPDVMLQLSRVGFSVSYTHFPWQHNPWDIETYFTLLAEGDNIEHFRSSAWVNTPDILTAELQQGLRQVFVSRLILAATLSASYGVYGPVFELQVAEAVREGSEEYAGTEKFQVRSWDLDSPDSLHVLMTTTNSIRRSHSALQHDRSLIFHHCSNPTMVAYTKTAPERVRTSVIDDNADDVSDETILVIVNTDHWNPQESNVRLELPDIGFEWDELYELRDLMTGAIYEWSGPDNFVRLDPWVQPAHVFALRPLRRPQF
ncbi:MAG: maltotransferase domain-containing protein [Ilumatobacteraceae bacterium]